MCLCWLLLSRAPQSYVRRERSRNGLMMLRALRTAGRVICLNAVSTTATHGARTVHGTTRRPIRATRRFDSAGGAGAKAGAAQAAGAPPCVTPATPAPVARAHVHTDVTGLVLAGVESDDHSVSATARRATKRARRAP